MGGKNRRPPPKPAGPKNWVARESGNAITFTREEVLTRLINTAVFLWFHGGDILSVHMLGAASYKTLRDITKKTDKVPWLTAAVGDEKLTVAYDFLRHASSDLSVVLDFPSTANLTLLAGAVTTFEAVFGYRTDCMSIVMLYFLAKRFPLDTPERKAAFGYLGDQYFPEDFVIEDFMRLEGAEFYDKAQELLLSGKVPAAK